MKFSLRLVILLTARVILKGSAANPRKLYLELQNSTEVETASLQYALDQANPDTSTLVNNSFVLERRNASSQQDPFDYASTLIQQDVVAVIDGQQHSRIPACVLSMFTGIPLVRLHTNHGGWDKCERMGVSLSASYANHALATAHQLETFHWHTIAVIYEAGYEYEASNFPKFVDEKTTVRMIQLHQHDNETVEKVVSRAIRELRKMEINVVILYADGLVRQKVMSEERVCDCIASIMWILQTPFPLNFTAPAADKVVGFRLPHKLNNRSKQYETSLKSKFPNDKIDLFTLKEKVVLAHDAVQVVSQALSAVTNQSDWDEVFNNTANRMSLVKHMKEVQVEGITGKIQFDESGLRSPVEFDVLNLQNNSFVKVGTWPSAGSSLSFRQNIELSADDLKLEGKRLRIVTIESPPFVFYKRDSNGNVTYEGYCIDLLEKVAERLKFTYDIYQSPDGAFGAEIDGKWTGMIGELVRQKADLAAASLTVTESREKVVDFTVAYMYFTSSMIMKKKSASPTDFLQFMMPFDIPVWLMLLACLTVVSIGTFVLNYYSPFGYKDETGRGTSSEFNFPNSLWFSLACMLQQGGDNTPKALSGRILAGCYWFCILIMVSTYTANLAAFFTVKNVDQPIKDLKDALTSDYEVGVTLGNSYYSFFSTSSYELYEQMWQQMKHRGSIPKSSTEAMQWVREKPYIHIDDGPILEYEANKQPCDLTTLPALSMEEALGFAVQSNIPHVKDISLEILRLRQNGYLDELRRKWWDSSSKCPKSTEDDLSGKRIGLESMAGVYMVLSGGLVLSFVVLAVEIYWHKKGKEKTKKHIQSLRTKRVIKVGPTPGATEPRF